VLLAAIGAAVGCALAYVSTGLIVSLIPYGFIPAESHVRLSPGVLLFAIGLAVVTGVLFGLAPARQAFRVDLNDALKQGSSKMVGSLSGRRMRHTLTVGEVALATLALCGAGALVRSFGNLQNQDLGFRPANVLTMRIGLPENHYSPAALTHFFEELLRRTRGVPAIEDVALASDLPLGPILSSAVTIDGASPETLGRVPEADYAAVSPGYFSLLAIPVTRGRAIGNQDSANTVRVAVINQTMAGLYWPNQDPLGKRFTFGPASPQTPWITVIGIARDVRQINVESGARQAFFIPFSQDPADSRVMSLLVRTKNEQGAVASAIREKIAELDPELPLYQVQLLETRIANSLGGERLAATMLVCFASICFALTMVGLYGVISYSAAQRVHEFGLRMALGASRASIVGIVVTEAGKLAISGIALGCAGAVFLGRVLSSLLYGATPADGPMLAAVSALLVTVAVSASLIPAVRAMRIDPNAALRHE
jgi:putative ABC transport system permease protein